MERLELLIDWSFLRLSYELTGHEVIHLVKKRRNVAFIYWSLFLVSPSAFTACSGQKWISIPQRRCTWPN